MTVTKESVKTKTNVELENWKKYFNKRASITIKEFSERKDVVIKHFVEIEAEMDVKRKTLIDEDAPKVDEKITKEIHDRISAIENEMNFIRDTQKSDEVKTNARLDFIRKQLDLINDELKARQPTKKEEVKNEKSEKKSTKKELIKKKIDIKTKKKTK